MTKRKRVPLGKPIQWTDADLDALATVSEADILAAGQWWEANAPKKFKELLKAKDATTDTETTTRQ